MLLVLTKWFSGEKDAAHPISKMIELLQYKS